MNDQDARFWRALGHTRPATGGLVGDNADVIRRLGVDNPIPYRPTTKIAARVPVSDQVIKMDFNYKFDVAAFERMKEILGIAMRPKVRNGDKVTISTTGYAQNVKADGTFEVAKTRTPFGDGEAIATLTAPATVATWRIDEHAPAKPKVGDVITGAELAAHAWKRGTVIDQLLPRDMSLIATHVLTADGDWVSVAGIGAGPNTFGGFASTTAKFRVVYVGR